jgi:hypothetical protein
MKKQSAKTSLKLSHETLRSLAGNQLREVDGAGRYRPLNTAASGDPPCCAVPAE